MTTFSLVTRRTSSNNFPSPLATDWTNSWVSESAEGGWTRPCNLFTPVVSSRSFKGTSSMFWVSLLSTFVGSLLVGSTMFPGPRMVTFCDGATPSAVPLLLSALSRNPPATLDSRTKHSLCSDWLKSWQNKNNTHLLLSKKRKLTMVSKDGLMTEVWARMTESELAERDDASTGRGEGVEPCD